jgi:hypothetical protein
VAQEGRSRSAARIARRAGRSGRLPHPGSARWARCAPTGRLLWALPGTRIDIEDGRTDDAGGDGPSRVNVRVQLQLLRAGVRLASLVPPQAITKINTALGRSGVPIDLVQLKPQQLEELIDQLDDDVDVDDPGAGLLRVTHRPSHGRRDAWTNRAARGAPRPIARAAAPELVSR